MADQHDVKIKLEGAEDAASLLKQLIDANKDPWLARYIEEWFAANHEPLFEMVGTGLLTFRVQPAPGLQHLLDTIRSRQ